MTLGCWADLSPAAHLAGLWAQADALVRGPGYYFSLPKLGLVLVVFFCWITTCTWVNRDADKLSLNTGLWNGLMLGAGLLGLLAVWAVPALFPGLLLFIVLYAGAALGYVAVRNRKVPADQRMLTEAHLLAVFGRLLRLQFRAPKRKTKLKTAVAAGGNAADVGGAEGKVPVRFLGRGIDQQAEDPERVARAEGSKGYKAALQMVYEAVQHRVTDIHLEPSREEMAVRFRIDGILQPADPFTRAMGDAVINIFKVLSNMDITEKRKPQDGSFSAQVESRMVDFRVATAGSVVGEKMVMRVLDRSSHIDSLAQLGMREKMHQQLHAVATQPNGMFVVCGPTGSGKSTTLYAALNEIDRYQQNVITLENPVEYHLSNATQIEVNTRAGKTFPEELRSILRQDPDVIMIGEIRDKETAEIACQAAQTGHMVYTTMHANDTLTAIGRLIDLGVPPFMIASALSAVLSQRLVRVLCPQCKVRYRPNPDLLRKLNLPADRIKYFYRPPEDGDAAEGGKPPEPCKQCGGTGYYGRVGIFELLVVNEGLRALIRENPNLMALKQEALKAGLRSLQEDGMRQVIEGRTSIAELLRVCK
jgi:type II secretory ATPase GspE/PulE/Tfp pilus assembly ATPase PilB-like protein